MSTFTRVIGFGDALRLEATTAPGGLNAAVKRIHMAVGTHIGSRNTFSKLFDSPDLPTSNKERLRAWLLLVALGQDPNDWSLGDVELPAVFSRKLLADLGMSASGWLSGIAA